jgi:Arc/MetJ-type ribon-helix-helix transcriptional regulator
MAMLNVRLTQDLVDRLDATVQAEGTNRARFVRRLIEDALAGKRPQRRTDVPDEDELVQLLSEKARHGNVAAIRSLLVRQEQSDPQTRAMAMLEMMVAERRQ